MTQPSSTVSRRTFLGATAAATAAVTWLGAPDEALADRGSFSAKAPAGFSPLSIPGRVVKVEKAGSLQDNGLYPKLDAARSMLERAMTELTGAANLAAAFAKVLHKDDKVAIKPNGIARSTMSSNKELVLAIVEGVLAAGVPASNITIFEQYPKFLAGTRVADINGGLDSAFATGIVTTVHENEDATMPEIQVGGIPTKFVRALTDATAVINVALIKDHSICGFTGCLKNITHGATINPHAFHEHNASPQIAHLYAQDVVKSRLRLHIVDGYKVIYDGGPMDKKPERRVSHEAVYATTDPVAMDVVGWNLVEKLRKDAGLASLAAAGREPSYLRVAGELGLGVFDVNRINLRSFTL